MAIAFDAATDGSLVNPGTSLTWSHTVTGSNPILHVAVFGDLVSGDATGVKITGVTYNAVAMTLVGKIAEENGATPANDRWVYLYELVGPATGAHNVVVSASASIAIAGQSVSHTGAKQSSQPDNFTTNSAAGASSITTSLTTVADGCWSVLAIRTSGGTVSAGSGSTVRTTNANGLSLADSGGPKTPAGSTSMAVTTAGSTTFGVVMASFSPLTAPVFDTARSNVAHSGNVHSGDFVQSFAVTVAGTDRTTKIWSDDTTITDILGSEPTVMEGVARGFALSEGQEVKVYNGGVDVGVPYFCGHVVRVQPASPRKVDQVAYTFTARDYTWFMDQRSRVTGYYDNIGANTLVRQLLASYAPTGFAGGYLPSTLGTITAISFENELLSEAITRIASQVSGGAFWSVEGDKTVSMWLASEENPRWAGTSLSVTDSTDQREPEYEVDISQIATRVIWEGGGGQTTAQVDAGSTTVTVNEIGWYSSSGGTVRGGPVIFTYTGVSAASGPGDLTGCSGITRDIAQGQSIYVRAQADDSAAQTALASLMGGDGIALAFYSDNRLSLAECTNRATADLSSVSSAVRSYRYATDDQVNTVSGKSVSVNVTKPATVNTSLRVQQVVIKKRSTVSGSTVGLERFVTCSPVRVTLSDLLLGVG